MEIKKSEQLLIVTAIHGTGENSITITVVRGNYGEHSLEDIVLEDLSNEEYDEIMRKVKVGCVLNCSEVIAKLD